MNFFIFVLINLLQEAIWRQNFQLLFIYTYLYLWKLWKKTSTNFFNIMLIIIILVCKVYLVLLGLTIEKCYYFIYMLEIILWKTGVFYHWVWHSHGFAKVLSIDILYKMEYSIPLGLLWWREQPSTKQIFLPFFDSSHPS